MPKVREEYVERKYEEIVAELEKLSFDYSNLIKDDTIWEYAWELCEAEIDAYYDMKHDEYRDRQLMGE